MEVRRQISNLLNTYKDLSYIESENIVTGKLFIAENDYYEVSIDLSPYPNRFPTVLEIGERIPKKADRHIYTDSGACCFTTTAKSQILLKTKIKSLESFIKLIVIPYFENNSYFEINKKYYTDEYSHNIKGVLEGYKDILGLENEYKIITTIHDRLTSNESKYKYKCYCGKTKPLRNCSNGKHFKKFNKFKLIDRITLVSDLTNILDYIKK
jgi:hypothetical protein